MGQGRAGGHAMTKPITRRSTTRRRAGTVVTAGATLGLIEVMKVFASIKTETAGVIERILVSSGEFVEFGQPLFLLRPN